MIKVEGLRKYFYIEKSFFKGPPVVIKAVDGVSFEIKKGRTLGLVGESGSGKSTVARLLLKLLELDDGKVYIDGRDIYSIKKNELNRLREKYQMVFQDPYESLNPKMRVGDIILEGPIIHKTVRKKDSGRDMLEGLLDMVGLALNAGDKYPQEFSGGERQRICIARALSVNPEFLILDEPTSNLDVSIQAQILNLLVDLKKRLNLTYLFISHNLSTVKFISDEILVMHQGRIVEHQNCRLLFRAPQSEYTKLLINSILEPQPNKARPKILVIDEAA